MKAQVFQPAELPKNFSYAAALREIGVTYIGGVKNSAKIEKSYKHGTSTYCIYISPATMANNGHNNCPVSKYCAKFCLNGSGQNKCDELARGAEHSLHNISRIKKSNAFWFNRRTFMLCVIHEINRAGRRAAREGRPFSVRLNGTSDISPELWVDPQSGKNLLELFPQVQFYDYTKVPSRLALAQKYANYDLTFSYNGHNMATANKFLASGGRVAVVFANQQALPRRFNGYDVVDGNQHDMRYTDPQRVIVGLTYHRVANDYVKIDGRNVFVEPDTEFVIKTDDSRCAW